MVQGDRRFFTVVLAVAEDEVDVAVPVQVELVDALQHPRARHIEILAAIAEDAPSEGLETPGNPWRGDGSGRMGGHGHNLWHGGRSNQPLYAAPQ